MEIVILDGYPATRGDYNYDFLKKYGDVIYYDRTPYELIAQRAKNADIVLANKIVIDKPIFDQLPKLKMIAMLATGYNSIDIQTAKERGIYVCNIPKYSSPSVAQFTFALLLEITNQVGLHNQSVKNGEWAACPDFCYNKTRQIELMGKTIGLIGNYGKSFWHECAWLSQKWWNRRKCSNCITRLLACKQRYYILALST